MKRSSTGETLTAPLTGAEFAVMRYLTRPKTTTQIEPLVTNARTIARRLLDRGLLERRKGTGVPGDPYFYQLSRLGGVVVAALGQG